MFDWILSEIYKALNMGDSVILGAGIAFAASGFVVWLVGIALNRLALGTIGAAAGCIAAFLYKDPQFHLSAVAMIFGAVLFIFLEKLVDLFIAREHFAYDTIFAGIFSVTGAVMLCLGLILLFHLRDIDVTAHIRRKRNFYATFIPAMFVFGTLIQLFFCRDPNKKYKRKKSVPKLEVEATEKLNWRNK